VVGVDGAASLATRVNQALQSGETLICGLNDRQSPENGAYFEVNGDSANRIVLERGGTEVATDTWTYPDGVGDSTTV